MEKQLLDLSRLFNDSTPHYFKFGCHYRLIIEIKIFEAENSSGVSVIFGSAGHFLPVGVEAHPVIAVAAAFMPGPHNHIGIFDLTRVE